MAAFNPKIKAKIVLEKDSGERRPCIMCGTRYPHPDAVHIIDKKEWCARLSADQQVNGMPLCPNCHRIFDEVLRPQITAALLAFGVEGLPICWTRNNKVCVQPRILEEEAEQIDAHGVAVASVSAIPMPTSGDR